MWCEYVRMFGIEWQEAARDGNCAIKTPRNPIKMVKTLIIWKWKCIGLFATHTHTLISLFRKTEWLCLIRVYFTSKSTMFCNVEFPLEISVLRKYTSANIICKRKCLTLEVSYLSWRQPLLDFSCTKWWCNRLASSSGMERLRIFMFGWNYRMLLYRYLLSLPFSIIHLSRCFGNSPTCGTWTTQERKNNVIILDEIRISRCDMFSKEIPGFYMLHTLCAVVTAKYSHEYTWCITFPSVGLVVSFSGLFGCFLWLISNAF